MKALTLHQPWASLMAAKVKTIETRSWPAPANAIGERVLITAAAVKPMPGPLGRYSIWNEDGQVWWLDARDGDPHSNDYLPLPLGHAVASGVLAACVPTTWLGYHQQQGTPAVTYDLGGAEPLRLRYWPGNDLTEIDVSDQAPYGIFCYERWAWLFDDLAPVTERCPACWNACDEDGGCGSMRAIPWGEDPRYRQCLDCGHVCSHHRCICDGKFGVEPFRVRGRQRLWNWEPVVAHGDPQGERA